MDPFAETKTVSASTLNYTNSSCLADSKTVTTPEVTIPCLTLGASSKIDVTCFGTSTGSVTAGTVTNSVGTVNYSWKNASNTVVGTTATVNNLPTGTYTLTITDNCFSKSNSVTILEPTSALTIVKTSQTDVLCFGTSIGAIDITASGGTGAYTYDWADITDTSNIEDRTGLAAGTYTVTVKDANGCSTAPLSVTILEPASAVTVVKNSQTDVLCFGTSTGAINITASGGTVAYTYDWADITGTSNIEDRTGLAAGTYIVTVKDANGCSTRSIIGNHPRTSISCNCRKNFTNRCSMFWYINRCNQYYSIWWNWGVYL